VIVFATTQRLTNPKMAGTRPGLTTVGLLGRAAPGLAAPGLEVFTRVAPAWNGKETTAAWVVRGVLAQHSQTDANAPEHVFAVETNAFIRLGVVVCHRKGSANGKTQTG
jgi:hypothetical protein